MPYFRLYHIKDGHFISFEDFEADGDLQAVARARELNGQGGSELWSGKRRVITLEGKVRERSSGAKA